MESLMPIVASGGLVIEFWVRSTTTAMNHVVISVAFVVNGTHVVAKVP
jgi:hypothetical protein